MKLSQTGVLAGMYWSQWGRMFIVGAVDLTSRKAQLAIRGYKARKNA